MKIFQVDTFTDKLFQGNPAAVIPLTEWLPDALMQNIAMENNLAETAFLVPQGMGYGIRWFTPTVEVELCGHATLASGHVAFEFLGFTGPTVAFYSLKSGELKVSREGNTSKGNKREGNKLTLDFPNNDPKPVDPLPVIFEGLRIPPRALFKGAFDYMVVLDNRRDIEALDPDFRILAKAPGRGIVVTARGKRSEGEGSNGEGSDGSGSDGEEPDFVSRCFYSQSGIDEDPVTGSAHTMMVPYWARQLGKTRLSAIQLSRRRGYLDCELAGDRVRMSGYAKTFLTGEVHINHY
jgi:PhzF family phenazine biosynthesis protein